MLLVVAVLLCAGCAAASLRRVFLVILATPFDLAAIANGLRGVSSEQARDLGAALARVPEADWEAAVFAASREPPDARAASLGEAATEIGFRTGRWARVPRVSATLASSLGFLLATISLRVGLSDLGSDVDAAGGASIDLAVFDAIDVAAVGLVGAAFCIAAQATARRALARRLLAADRLIQTVDGLPVLEDA